ncbi:IS3 family transposase, partial [Evansella clarkii]|uniref:IS3 family transposase n=1 Tax=Evansella clarkii TaxID=79879 RepID=UPI001C4830C9
TMLSKRLKFIPSMSRKANCWDNAVIESFFSQLKTEFPHFYPTTNLVQVQLDFKKYIRFYNEERIQKKMGYASPKEYHKRYLHAI